MCSGSVICQNLIVQIVKDRCCMTFIVGGCLIPFGALSHDGRLHERPRAPCGVGATARDICRPPVTASHASIACTPRSLLIVLIDLFNNTSIQTPFAFQISAPERNQINHDLSFALTLCQVQWIL